MIIAELLQEVSISTLLVVNLINVPDYVSLTMLGDPHLQQLLLYLYYTEDKPDI